VINRILLGLLVEAALLAQSNPAQSNPQTLGSTIFKQPPKVTGPAPHFADGIPDLSGAWMGGGSNSGDFSKALAGLDSDFEADTFRRVPPASGYSDPSRMIDQAILRIHERPQPS
jgi:hypothetical protein